VPADFAPPGGFAGCAGSTPVTPRAQSQREALYSPGTPLTMSPGTTSGPMLVNIISDHPPNEMMAAWNFRLTIAPVLVTVRVQ
jgi:hypothetical protein